MDNQKNLQIGLDWFNKSFSCVKITHKGDEVFRKTDKTIVPVTHEPVTFQFKYNAQKMIWNEANHYVENPEELLLIGGMDATIVSTGDYAGGVYPPDRAFRRMGDRIGRFRPCRPRSQGNFRPLPGFPRILPGCRRASAQKTEIGSEITDPGGTVDRC